MFPGSKKGVGMKLAKSLTVLFAAALISITATAGANQFGSKVNLSKITLIALGNGQYDAEQYISTSPPGGLSVCRLITAATVHNTTPAKAPALLRAALAKQVSDAIDCLQEVKSQIEAQ
jgi:hypothetical protein